MKRPPLARSDRIGFAGIALIIVYQAMIPPVVSLANNGDFSKISGHFSIGYPPELEGRYAPVKFHHDARYEYHAEFRTTENLLAIAAAGASSILSKTGDFDIRLMGAIHGALFLASVWLLLPVLVHFFGPRARIAVLLSIAVVLCDVLYVANFNSFYMDAAALVFLPLAAVFFARGVLWRSRWDAAGLALCGTLLAGAKPQHALLAIPIAGLLFVYRNRIGSARIAWLGIAGALGAAMWTLTAVNSDYHRNSWYNVIFLGLLPHSSSPADDLAGLGLERAWVCYSGTAAYSSNGGFRDAEFTNQFAARVNGATLARFYVRHPVRTWGLVVRAFSQAGATRPIYGNFDPSEGLPPFARSRAFAEWSGLRARVLARHGVRFLEVTLAIAALLVVRARGRWRWAAVWFTIALLLDAGVSSLADAMEAARHFTLFCELEDTMLLIVLWSFLPRRREGGGDG